MRNFTGNRQSLSTLICYFTSNRCSSDFLIMILSSSHIISMVWPALKPESCSHLPHSSMVGKYTELPNSRLNHLLHTVSRLVFAVGIRTVLYSKTPLGNPCILHRNPVFYGFLYCILQLYYQIIFVIFLLL